MRNNRRVDGYDFEFVSQDQGNDEFYQCRGAIMYDDDHDEQPESGLWDAALKLESMLKSVYDREACASHSEKGWVEVQLLN